jgi:hypothetical protein
MPLPKIDKPLFELRVPSMDRTVMCRPFVVREEKILLTAQQSGAEKDIILAIKQVLENCIQDATFDSNKMTTYDLEYMFLKLRARSVNNVIEVSYRDNEDEKLYDFEIDLDEVEMMEDKEINSKIMITEDVGMILRFPSVSQLANVPDGLNASDVVEHLVFACVDQIFDENDVYPADEQTREDLKEFIDSLDVATFEKIRLFFDAIPSLYHKLEYTNSLGNPRMIELKSLSDFFTWG